MIHILFVGDSLVADNDWQPRMKLHKVQNLGVPGATAGDLLNTLPKIKEQTEQVDVIMIMVGTNDLLNDNFQFIKTLKAIIVQLRQNYPGAEILVNNLFPMHLPHLPHNAITSFNTHIEAITVQTGCCYLDTHSKFLNSGAVIFQADGVHITETAYEIWTRNLLEHIAFLIEDD